MSAPDLTRWNRAGLTRFDYVDGNVAVWLEELRIALLGLYARDPALMEQRTPAALRDIFLETTDPARREGFDLDALLDALVWDRLATPRPRQRTTPDPETGESIVLETRGERAARLLAQYRAGQDGDHAWEILRATARMAHVLLGHLDAYANEGYLRTATQWDNLRRLAAMVGHQPVPPASATTLIALEAATASGTTDIAAGLAMKWQPESGPPLTFETLAKLSVHPDLNATHVAKWDDNPGRLKPYAPIRWVLPDKVTVSPGDVAVYAAEDTAIAMQVKKVDLEGEEVALVELSDSAKSNRSRSKADAFAGVVKNKKVSPITTDIDDTLLHVAPEDVRVGRARTGAGGSVIIADVPISAAVGDMIEVRQGADTLQAIVTARNGLELTLSATGPLDQSFEIVPMTPVGRAADGGFITENTVSKMYWQGGSGVASQTRTGSTYDNDLDNAAGYAVEGRRFTYGGASEVGWFVDGDADAIGARRLDERKILPDAPNDSVTFDGKPPKSVVEGAWFVARDTTTEELVPLKVMALAVSPGQWHVEFDASVDRPDQAEFYGPMTVALEPVGAHFNPAKLGSGARNTITLTKIAAAAAALLRPGRRLILSDGGEDISATLTSAEETDDGVVISYDMVGDPSEFVTGSTRVRLNAVTISHGETKGPQVLGSGDAERTAQSFAIPAKVISHVPSTLSETGVIPDITVTVDGRSWAYTDYVDPSAEGTESWSTTLDEDDVLHVHFRRRLPTGQDNVVLRRHRIGAGVAGNDVPAFAIAEPKVKHATIKAIYQPFETAGGADREAVESLRVSAPSRLAANGRAVSVADFVRLAERNSSIWRARANETPSAIAERLVRLTVVPAGGGKLAAETRENLRLSLLADAVPGIRVAFDDYVPVPLVISASVRADLTAHDKSDLKAAAEDALGRAFALEARDFGQPVYVSEVLAALETVEGVETAVILDFRHDVPANAPDEDHPRSVAERDDAIAAIYPRENQVAHLVQSSAATVEVEGLA